jgi:hypothetical protein
MITDLRQTRLSLDHTERRLSMIERLLVAPAFKASPNQFSPKNIGPDGEVTIFGRNLDLEPITVQFGAHSVTPKSADPRRIVARVPAIAGGEVRVTITTAGGTVTSDDILNIRTEERPPAFADPPNEFNPKAGVAGTSVTLFGTHFDLLPVSVAFGNVQAAEVRPGAEQTTVVVPAGLSAPVHITVTTAQGTTTSTETFKAGGLPAFAATNAIKPALGGVGASVVLSGVNFDVEPVKVEFGTVPATVISFTNQEIRTRVPAGAPSRCTIKVTTGVGSVISTQEFTVAGSG